MSDTWSYRRETRRGYVGRKVKAHKVVAGILGFVLALSAGALAAWVVVPNSAGTGYGKAKDATSGLALVSLEVQSDDPSMVAVGPNDTGMVAAIWQNPNPFTVDIRTFRYVTGTPITKVGDPSCTAAPSTFNIETANVPAGSWSVPSNGGTRTVAAQITTTADFPACLAGGMFAVQVEALAQPASA